MLKKLSVTFTFIGAASLWALSSQFWPKPEAKVVSQATVEWPVVSEPAPSETRFPAETVGVPLENSIKDKATDELSFSNQLTQEYEQDFSSETVDPDWAMQTENELEKRLLAVLPAQSQVKSIECRKTLCRIQVWHDDETRADESVNQALLPETQHWPGESFAALEEKFEDGTVSQLIFLRR